MKRLYEEEVRKLWSKVYTANEDEIASWLEKPLTNFVRCADAPQAQENKIKRLRDGLHRSRRLKDFAVFIIAAPLSNQFTTVYINGQEYHLSLDETEKLSLEIKDLKERTVLGKVEKDGLLDSVFATTFEEVKLKLQIFMREKGTEANEIRIIFMGHGADYEGQGTMCFQKGQPVTNAQLFDAVKEYRDENGDRLLGSAISIVLTQCFSHLGIGRIPQEENLTVTPLASDDCPYLEVETQQECQFVGDTDENTFRLPLEEDNIYMSFAWWHQTGRLAFPVKKAERHHLVKWLNGDLRVEEPMDTGVGSMLTQPTAAS